MGGPVTNIPINSCQSGNRPVSLEGLGCEGGNESVKGSIVQFSLTSFFSNIFFNIRFYYLISTWVDTMGGREGKGQVPTMVVH